LELEEANRGRRSVRVYTNEPVPMELVRKVLEAGTWAPSAKNGQQWRFTVLTGESKRRLIEAMREELDATAKRIGRGAMGSSFSSCAIMEEAPVVSMIWNAGNHAMSAAGRVAIFLKDRGAEDLALWAEMEGYRRPSRTCSSKPTPSDSAHCGFATSYTPTALSGNTSGRTGNS
jgi:nitroreductase